MIRVDLIDKNEGSQDYLNKEVYIREVLLDPCLDGER